MAPKRKAAAAPKVEKEPEAAPPGGPTGTMQILSLLQELRAQVQVIGASLDKGETTLTRLTQRVERMERDATPICYDPHKPVTPTMRFADLPPAELAHVARQLAPDDELAASLACTKLRAAVATARTSRPNKPPLKTSLRSLVRSYGRLQWGVSCGAPVEAKLAGMCAERGDIQQLAWLRSNCSCTINADTCAIAAEGGHTELLQWLRTNSCPWDNRVITLAEKNGHAALATWAKERGCPAK